MRHYVYCLFRPDGRPFYIGKGTGNRWLDHRRCQNNDKNRHKVAIIKAAKATGLLTDRSRSPFLNEDEAFELEMLAIQFVGREPCGPLVNMTDGGEGATGPKSLTHRAAIGAALRGKKKSHEHAVKCKENLRKAAIARAVLPKEALAAATTKAMAASTTEQKQERQRRAWLTRCANNPGELDRMRAFGKTQMTPERNRKAIEAAAAQSPEARHLRVIKANQGRTPEQRIVSAKKGWETRRVKR